MEEARFYLCRSCRNQVLLSEDNVFMGEVINGKNAVNVRVADAESHFLFLGCTVVEVFCNGCSSALGCKLLSQDGTTPAPEEFIFRLDLLLSPDGNPIVHDDTDEEVEDK